MSFTLPPIFTLAHYRLTLEALDALSLLPFKGSALRGGFGHTFERPACHLGPIKGWRRYGVTLRIG